MKKSLTELHQILTERFSEGELKTLSLHLEIDFEDLGGAGKTDKALELIAYLERRKQISKLILIGRKLRPDIDWDNLLQAAVQNENQKIDTLIFYTPTIRANSFFASLLEYVLDRISAINLNVIIEKGELYNYHKAGNYIDIIKKYGMNHSINSVLIMIPPRPESYDAIWNLQEDLNINLVTLDMGFDENKMDKFESCKFHKQVILVDNRLGAQIAAKEVIYFCSERNLDVINVLICEGTFHERGYLFKEELNRISQNVGIKVNYLKERIEKLPFSDAVKKARRHVIDTFRTKHEDLKSRDTFIFCANDNMALGARMGVSNLDPKILSQYRDIRIICFDASVFVRMHIEHEDRFLWRAIDQNYTEIVNQALNSADVLFRGEDIKKEVVWVKPRIFRR